MSEENEGTEPSNAQEEVYVPIFIELCDLTTNIIKIFTDDNIIIECNPKYIENGYYTIIKNLITDKKILNLDKYDINDSTKQIKTHFWQSYPPIFYVKLSKLIQNLNVTQNNHTMNDNTTNYIVNLVKKLQHYYTEQKNNKRTYNVSSQETSGYYGDSAQVTSTLSKDEYLTKYWSDNIQSGGTPSRKRKSKKTKRRKNTQKKNTKKRYRK